MGKKCEKIFEKAKENPAGLRFAELKALCFCFGMSLDRMKGSHYIFIREAPFFLFSIQKMKNGKAKPYQVKQLLAFVEENDLVFMAKE